MSARKRFSHSYKQCFVLLPNRRGDLTALYYNRNFCVLLDAIKLEFLMSCRSAGFKVLSCSSSLELSTVQVVARLIP